MVTDEYDFNMHLAQRLENLLNAKEAGDIPGFENVLNDIKKLQRQNPDLLKGFLSDETKTKEQINDLFSSLRNHLNKALENKNNENMILDTDQALQVFRNDYNMLQLQYMESILDSITSFYTETVEDQS